MKSTCGKEMKVRRVLEGVLGKIFASFSLPFFGAAESVSTGKTIAWFVFCLKLVLVAHYFCSDLQDALLISTFCTDYD